MKYVIAMLLVGCVMVRPASAEFIIRTDTTLNFRIVFDVGSVSIIDGVAGPTTVEIVDGAVISPDVSVTDHSVLNLRGGETQRGVGAGGFATINVFGGLVAGEDLIVIDHSTANVYGGILGDDIHAHGSAVVNLYGGTFAGFGGGAMLLVQEDGVINVFGWDLEIDLDPPGAPFPQLQGFLTDGSPLDVRLFDNGATLGLEQIVLHQIPEPSAFSICLIGLFLMLIDGRVRGRRVTLSCGRQDDEKPPPAGREQSDRVSYAKPWGSVMKYAIAMLLVGCVLVRSASAELIIATDMTIDYRIAFSNGTVRVIDGFAGPTTVEVVDGADIIPHLGVSEHSVLNLRGGVTQRGVGAGDFGTINIFGGLHADEDLTMGDHSTANIYGGILADDIHASGSSVVNLYGGTFAKAGGGALLGVEEDGVINIFGWGFEIDLDPPTSPSFPRLTGFLNDGSPLDVRLFNESATLGFKQIVLHEIPEPATFSICFIGLLLLLLNRRVRGRGVTLRFGRQGAENSPRAALEQSDRTSKSKLGMPIMKYAIAALLVGCVMVRSASAEFIITADTTIDYFVSLENDFVVIDDGVAGPTTVEIVDGADIHPSVGVRGHSVLNIRGGVTHRAVGVSDQSTLNVFGGLVGGEDISVGDHATANLYGGIYGDDINAGGSAVVNLYGGTFEGFGKGAFLLVQEDGVINVFGSDLEIDLDPPGSPFPRLQGFLSDGSPLDVRLITEELNLGSAEIVLHQIPEPSAFSLGLFGLFLMFLYGRVRGRRVTLSCGRQGDEKPPPAARENGHYVTRRLKAR